ncbi:MAG: DUF2079 domain-containing protein [Cytophagales bacterium]|nr:DUF2079 domain-containing protein [Cytophagales bacterium]
MKSKTSLYLTLLAVIFAAGFSYVYYSHLHISGDNYDYLIFAKSILSGHGYQSPLSGEFQPTNHYPPGFSALLAFFMVFTKKVSALKVMNGMLLLAGAFLSFFIAKRFTQNSGLAFVTACLVILNRQLLHFASMLMSETAYMCFILLAMLCLFKYEDGKKTFWKSPFFWGTVLASSAAYYFRSVGISLAAAVMLHFLFRKRWKEMLAYAGSFVLLYLPWVVRNSSHGFKSRYFGTIMTVNPWRPEQGTISSFGEMWSKMLDNFDETVIRGFVDALFPFMNIKYMQPQAWHLTALGIAVLLIVLWGAWNLGKYRFLMLGLLLANIGIFMLWHGGNGSRYVTPIVPLLILCFYFGIFSLLRLKWNTPRQLQWMPFGFLLILLFMSKPLKQLHKIAQSPEHPAYKNYFQIAKGVKRSLPKGVRIACRKPAMFYLHAERPVTNYKYSKDDQEVIRDLVQKEVDYVVLEQLGYSSTGLYLFPAIQNNRELFTTRASLQNPNTYLLAFDRKKAKEKLGITAKK